METYDYGDLWGLLPPSGRMSGNPTAERWLLFIVLVIAAVFWV